MARRLSRLRAAATQAGRHGQSATAGCTSTAPWGNTPAVRRDANGRLLSGASLNPGGRPVSAITELRARYLPRLDELMEELMELATNSQNEMVRLGAIREILDRLLGRAAISVDTTVTKMDIGERYRQALKLNQRIEARIVWTIIQMGPASGLMKAVRALECHH
jgi:hypothetical protein